jgi:hypothetical protein
VEIYSGEFFDWSLTAAAWLVSLSRHGDSRARPDRVAAVGTKKKVKTRPPRGLNEAARKERERFMAEYEGFLQDAKNKVSLSIHVWGPNPRAQSTVAKKRKEIHQELGKLGHNAMLSEDLPIGAVNLSAKSREFAQARAAHLIIILVEGSPGALAEAHDFCTHPDIAPKILVMIPSRFRAGYSGLGAIKDLEQGHGGVHWYSASELRRCNVRERAIQCAEARRNMTWVHTTR